MFAGCDDDDTASDEYFPIDNGHRWSYQRWIFGQKPEDFSGWLYDTVRYEVARDTILEGLPYKIITMNGEIDKVIRRAGTSYYMRWYYRYNRQFFEEIRFLDTSKRPGVRWEHIPPGDEYSKTVFVVKAWNTTRKVKDKTYRNVIVIEEQVWRKNSIGDYTHRDSSLHFYARDVGEVFLFLPYVRDTYINNANYVLMGNDSMSD